MLLTTTITPAQAVLRSPNMQRITLPSIMALSRMSYNTSARKAPRSPLVRSANTQFIQMPARPANMQRPLTLMSAVGLRPFSTTPLKPFKVTPMKPFAISSGTQFSFFPSKRSKQIEKEAEAKTNAMPVVLTEPAWPHPVYTEKQMNDIKIAHRQTKNWSDWIALSAVRILRWSFDLATGYKHDKQIALGKRDAAKPKNQMFTMTTEKWLVRFIFLESIAGVPGMVGGMVRHLHSLRALRRDNGWIETLLEEAYNERMHLLTFLKLREPGWFMRAMILGAQGIFFNGFFLGYLISPRTCHRFVGYLEEEAVITYTRAIADIEAGKLPEWENTPAPNIAVNYWRMPEGHRTMKDLLNYVRADEAKHREVNHTLANLAQVGDPNPFLTKYELPDKKPLMEEHPTKGLEYTKPIGWDRQEVLEKVGRVLPRGHSMQA